MKVFGKVENALVMTKKVEQGKKDPNKVYYYVGIVKDDELGELSATEEVYNSVERGHVYNFGTCYNSNFDLFQLEKSFPVGSPVSEKSEPSDPPVAGNAGTEAIVDEKKDSKPNKK